MIFQQLTHTHIMYVVSARLDRWYALHIAYSTITFLPISIFWYSRLKRYTVSSKPKTMCSVKRAQCTQLLIFTISGTICTLILARGEGGGGGTPAHCMALGDKCGKCSLIKHSMPSFSLLSVQYPAREKFCSIVFSTTIWDKFSRQMFATEFDKGKGNINETLKLFKNNTMNQQVLLNLMQLCLHTRNAMHLFVNFKYLIKKSTWQSVTRNKCKCKEIVGNKHGFFRKQVFVNTFTFEYSPCLNSNSKMMPACMCKN